MAISCRLVLDSASQNSYITKDLANKLQLEPFGEETLNIGTFGSNSSRDVKLPVTAIRIRSQTGTVIDMTVNIAPTISAPIRKEKINISNFEFITGMTLAEPLNLRAEDIRVNVLIGQDYYNDVLGTRSIKLDDGLYMTKSFFGWVLSGRTENSKETSDIPPSTILLAPVNGISIAPVDSMMEKFWGLESLGIQDDPQISDDDAAREQVLNSMIFQGGRYDARFPWKDPAPDLPQNYELALGRLKSLQKRLERQTDVCEK